MSQMTEEKAEDIMDGIAKDLVLSKDVASFSKLLSSGIMSHISCVLRNILEEALKEGNLNVVEEMVNLFNRDQKIIVYASACMLCEVLGLSSDYVRPRSNRKDCL